MFPHSDLVTVVDLFMTTVHVRPGSGIFERGG